MTFSIYIHIYKIIYKCRLKYINTEFSCCFESLLIDLQKNTKYSFNYVYIKLCMAPSIYVLNSTMLICVKGKLLWAVNLKKTAWTFQVLFKVASMQGKTADIWWAFGSERYNYRQKSRFCERKVARKPGMLPQTNSLKCVRSSWQFPFNSGTSLWITSHLHPTFLGKVRIH